IQVLFIADPSRKEKNFALAQEACALLEGNAVELKNVYNVHQADIPLLYATCDVVLMTSTEEGSPHVIKEALACNCRIVCTDVGDVRWLTEGVRGCYIAGFSAASVAGCITRALGDPERTLGRDRLVELSLDADTVAGRVISIYESVVG